MTALALVGASLRRGARTVLSDVDLDVRPGELTAVLGPNGAGKSTVLAALSGDLPLTTGEVLLDGRPLAELHPRERARRRAVLLQSSAVAFPFRVREVVTMGRAPWPASPQDAAAVEAALELLDLHHLADAPVTRLSGGEQARTALARVLAQDTPALLLDEPTAALDLRHAETALRHLAGLAAAGRTVVVVLHDLDLAAAHADRLVLVADGHVVADGPASAVLTGDVLTSAYGHPVEVLPHPRTGRPVVLPIG